MGRREPPSGTPPSNVSPSFGVRHAYCLVPLCVSLYAADRSVATPKREQAGAHRTVFALGYESHSTIFRIGTRKLHVHLLHTATQRPRMGWTAPTSWGGTGSISDTRS